MNNDLISREALKEEIGSWGMNDYEPADFIEAIDNAPTVELFCSYLSDGEVRQPCVEGPCEDERPQDEWIPVSERLPEERINPDTMDFDYVLCSTIWNDVRPYKYGKPIGQDKAHFWHGGGIMDGAVIAWQPLPEPYKEGGES